MKKSRSNTKTSKKDEKLPSKLSGIIGKVQLPKDFDDKKELFLYLKDKHLS